MTGRIGVLISGSGTNLQALIDAFADDPAVEVAVVISNKADAYGLTRAKVAGISTAVVDHRGKRRSVFDAVRSVLSAHQVTWVRWRASCESSRPCSWTPSRAGGQHPPLAPAGLSWDQCSAAGRCWCRCHGGDCALVDAGMDTGPIIVRGRCGGSRVMRRRPAHPGDGASLFR